MSWRLYRGKRKDGKGHAAWPGAKSGKYVYLHASRGDSELGKLQERLALGAALNYAAPDGTTALIRAAAGGHLRTVEELLDAGCAKDLQDKRRWSALTHAAVAGRTEVCLALVRAGAAWDVACGEGRTPEQWAVERGHTATAEALREATKQPTPRVPTPPREKTPWDATPDASKVAEFRREMLHKAAVRGKRVSSAARPSTTTCNPMTAPQPSFMSGSMDSVAPWGSFASVPPSLASPSMTTVLMDSLDTPSVLSATAVPMGPSRPQTVQFALSTASLDSDLPPYGLTAGSSFFPAEPHVPTAAPTPESLYELGRPSVGYTHSAPAGKPPSVSNIPVQARQHAGSGANLRSQWSTLPKPKPKWKMHDVKLPTPFERVTAAGGLGPASGLGFRKLDVDLGRRLAHHRTARNVLQGGAQT